MAKIVVFGSRGNIGGHLVETLYPQMGQELRLISSSQEGVSDLSARYPNADTRYGDLSSPESIQAAIKDAERVFVMYPDFEFDEEASTLAMIQAVRDTPTIKQVVRLLGVVSLVEEDDIPLSFRQQPAMPCWVHFRGRQLWRQSGLPVTFINPWSWYMQSLPWLAARGVVEQDTFCLPFSHTLPYIDTRDISEVAAKVLTEPVEKYVNEELALTGHEDDCFSFEELAEQFSEHLEREISYSGSISLFEQLLGEGAAPLLKYIGWEQSIVKEYRAHTDTVERLLGRQPRRFADWLRQTREQFAPLMVEAG
ncbi:NmrA family NAD(P)-binding protein [Pseudomaricurvus alkylphenolicus]|jgi:uncharacterized protein YbjT (DUF2867 family)|uniref:NmrA family NAD(P)-binding protein n=1 Tax=Pseudomaricurvus alkylphenolicus TaxID=1306991 RepID=UPI00142380F2|nr:NmrA family NAD(P)-binding protein [Pseudomaricurvus alkylphenolicus]NIB41617.1 NmrA family NAD(P)-binding protein [Pseudomaricurvus alkylphenolicus]